MDTYQSIVDYLLTFSVFDSWSDMANILQRAASARPRDWALPILACQALGESPEKAIPASAALACAQISVILVDDMLDDDPRGAYHRMGSGRAANLAVAFQSAGVDALLDSSASGRVQKEAVKCLSQMMSLTAFGQELDIRNPADETHYWQVVENKSAPFYGCAFHLGALLAEAEDHLANEIRKLGELYGEIIQIHDDLNDTMAVPANPAWLQGRKPLPILFAQTVEHPDQYRFLELYQDISARGALQEAQEILIRCGAVSYCVDQLLVRYQAAQHILDKIPLPEPGTLDTVIEAVIAPVHRLFDTLGISPPSLPTSAELENLERSTLTGVLSRSPLHGCEPPA